MAIDYTQVEKQIDETNLSDGIVRFWTFPRAVNLTDEELDTRIPLLYRSYRLNRKGLGEYLVEKHRRLSRAGCKGEFKAFLEKVEIPRSSAYEIMGWYNAVGQLNTVLLDAAEDEIGWAKMLRPRILRSLTEISLQLNGRVPIPKELSTLFNPFSAKSSAPESGADKDSDGEADQGSETKPEKNNKNSKPPLDPDPAEWTRKAESVDEARAYCKDLIPKLPEEDKNDNPLLVAFVKVEPSASLFDQISMLFQLVVRNRPQDEQASIGEMFVQAAQNELDSLRQELNRPIASAEQISMALATSAGEGHSASENAAPSSESVAKLRRRLLLDSRDGNDVLEKSPVIGERKPVTSEATLDEASAVTA